MSHVTDELELCALGALEPRARDRVAAHLDACVACAGQMRQLEQIVAALPDALAPVEPPAGLRERVLEAARAHPPARRRRLRLRTLALAAGLVLLLGLNAAALARLGVVQAERDAYVAMAEHFSQGGRWWYMAGEPEFGGSGGTLVVPRTDQRPFVLFHDLRALPQPSMYVLWLIDADGRWVRGPSFVVDGRDLQLVELGMDLGGFERCAVTVEAGPEGRREGPLVMQSRIVPPQ